MSQIDHIPTLKMKKLAISGFRHLIFLTDMT